MFLSIALACTVVSFALTGLLIRHANKHSLAYAETMPQRFHFGHVPRLGGLAMFACCTLAWGYLAAPPAFGLQSPAQVDPRLAFGLWLTALVPVTAGIADDITQRIAARWRLMASVLSACIAVFALQLTLDRSDVSLFDAWLRTQPWLGMMLLLLIISGAPHSFNMIDGYNGLASTVGLICFAVLGYVSYRVDDLELLTLSLTLAGSTVGFLIWNYPRGLIFAGDGGAYLWGTTIATVSILLVVRHSEVSPWFPILLMSYPIQETVFSIYRKTMRGESPACADALHLHQLIHRRIVRRSSHSDIARRILVRNNRTAPYLWALALLTLVPAALFWNRTGPLILATATFIAAYVVVYFSIVRFKGQRWTRRKIF